MNPTVIHQPHLFPGDSPYQPRVHPSTLFRMNGWGRPVRDEWMGGRFGMNGMDNPALPTVIPAYAGIQRLFADNAAV